MEQAAGTISAVSHALPPDPAVLAILSIVFMNDFVFWSMVHLSPRGLLVALGVPLEVQKQLSPKEVARLNAFLESILPMGARRNGQLLDDHMSEYESEQIQHIQVPTLVLHARDDTLISFEHGEFIARNIPGAQFIPMEKGGHLAVMVDINTGARKKLQEFLEQDYSR
jgi:pimeloyl-ACP methyl ester carboxylesterase